MVTDWKSDRSVTASLIVANFELLAVSDMSSFGKADVASPNPKPRVGLLTSGRHYRCGVDGGTSLWVLYVSWEETAVTPDERRLRFAVELGEPYSGECAHGRLRNFK